MRTCLSVVALVVISMENTGTNAFLSQMNTKVKASTLFSQIDKMNDTQHRWSPHMVLGDEKIEALAEVRRQEDDAKKAATAKSEADEQAKLDSIAKQQIESEKKAAAEKSKKESDVAESARLAAVASAKKDADAKAVADAAATLAKSEVEAQAAEAAAEEEAAADEAEEAMILTVQAAKEEALEAEANKRAVLLKRQEELSRLAAVASKANDLENAESERKATAPALQGILSDLKTPIQQLISAETVSASVPNEDMDIFDVMQASAEAEANKGSGVSAKLEVAITILAKAPLPRLRRLITKYKESLLPNLVSTTLEETVLQSHLKAALEALWSNSDGSWEKLMNTLNEELGKQAEETSLWMKASIIAANQLSETRLKALIRQFGGIDSMPRLKNGSTEKMDKTVLVAALVDVLREINENDYSRVAPILQAESAKGGGKKGFSSVAK